MESHSRVVRQRERLEGLHISQMKHLDSCLHDFSIVLIGQIGQGTAGCCYGVVGVGVVVGLATSSGQIAHCSCWDWEGSRVITAVEEDRCDLRSGHLMPGSNREGWQAMNEFEEDRLDRRSRWR